MDIVSTVNKMRHQRMKMVHFVVSRHAYKSVRQLALAVLRGKKTTTMVLYKHTVDAGSWH